MNKNANSAASVGALLQELQKGSWFGAIPTALQSVIIQRSVLRSYGKSQAIVNEGDATKGMYCVLKGRVRAVRFAKNGEEVLLDVGGVGYWFAVYGMLANAPSIGSVIADTPVVILNLSEREFARIVEREPRFYPHFAKLLIEQFARVFRHLGEVQALTPEQLLLTRLKDMLDTRKLEHTTNAGADEIKVSQSDLATMVGVSRQTLSTLLSRLVAKGRIEIGYRRIRLLP